DVQNLGPGTAQSLLVLDLPPLGPSQSFTAPSLAVGATTRFQADVHVPAGPTTCEAELTNLALVTSGTPDTNLVNNLSARTARFDKNAVRLPSEICANGLDDNCDGLIDCGDPACDCMPVLPPAPGGDPACSGTLFTGLSTQPSPQPEFCAATDNPASQ